MSPKRVQITRSKPWRDASPDAIIVARPSVWGNPFRVGWKYFVDFLSRPHPDRRQCRFEASTKVLNRAHAVGLFRAWLEDESIEAREYAEAIPLLKGRDLACWCPLDAHCHADVLLELANREVKP